MNIKIDLYLILSLVILFFFRQVEQFAIFYFFVFIHEVAHITVAQILKIKIIDISLLPFGVNAKFEFGNHKIKEILIASAGPLFSFAIAMIFEEFFIQNIFIFIVNMLPIYPLDGGRILKNLFLLFFGNTKGAQIYNILLKSLIIILLIINMMLIIFLKYFNFIFVGLYVIQLAEEEIKKDKLKKQISSLLNVEI